MMRLVVGGPITFAHPDIAPRVLVSAKAGRRVSVCIPARDEEHTVGKVVRAVVRGHVAAAGGTGLVDEVLVVDDGSSDATPEAALASGAVVLSLRSSGDKGQAMRAALGASDGDLVVFLDADVENTDEHFVSGLLYPLLMHEGVALVKGYYDRPLDGQPTGGGRVTELVARPVLELFFPHLSTVRQPLAGETAATRSVLDSLELADGYGVEIGLLIDVARRFGPDSIAQVDLGIRIHRNRPLEELRPQARQVLAAALSRATPPVARGARQRGQSGAVGMTDTPPD